VTAGSAYKVHWTSLPPLRGRRLYGRWIPEGPTKLAKRVVMPSTTVQLSAVLTLPRWARAVQVLAGGVPDREVRSIRAVHDLGEAYVVERDELLMVLEPATLGDWRMDTLLRRIASAQGIGVLLRAGPPFESTCQLAGRLGLVLLETAAEPLDLLVDARVALAQPALERAELVLAAFDELTGRLEPPADVVDRLSALLGAPVGLLDDGGGLLTGAASHVEQLRLRTAEPQRIELGDALVLVHPARLPQATRPSHWLTVELSGSARSRAMSVASVLHVAAAAVERWLLIHRMEHERSARARAALLGDLLRSTGEPPADLRSRAADAGGSSLDGTSDSGLRRRQLSTTSPDALTSPRCCGRRESTLSSSSTVTAGPAGPPLRRSRLLLTCVP
jgi:purine catabolism regulator